MNFLPVLHGLRALAALAVLLFHWLQFFPAFPLQLADVRWGPEPWMNLALPLASGWQGVPLFFVLSAFLLTSQWQGRRLDGGTVLGFWHRRFLRIYPAFWLQLVVLLLVAWFVDGLLPPYSGQDLLLNSVIWVNLPPTMTQPLNGVWWTLPVELMFYLFLPALVAVQRRIGWFWVALACLAITVGWRLAMLQAYAGQPLAPHLHVIDALPGSLATFAAGFAVAHAQWRPSAGARRLSLALLLFVYLALQYWLWINNAVYLGGHWMLCVWVPSLAVALACGVYLSVQSPTAQRWLGGAIMVWLGEVSFGIYLWHYPVLKLLSLWMPRAGSTPEGSVLALGLALVMTLTLAGLSFHWVESRVMGWSRVGARARSLRPQT